MAETTYKKGELLFEGNITTTNTDGFIMGDFSINTLLNQEVLLTEFNNIEYVCEANKSGSWYIYGGFNPSGPDFTNYPFAFYQNDASNTRLYTENPGTYSLKIYTAIPDSDSDSSSEPVTIRSYIDKNLTNLNWNILPQIFESEGVELTEKIERYLRETPKNTNWNIVEQLKEEGKVKEIIAFSGTIFRSSNDGDYDSVNEFPNSDLPSALDRIHVTFDGIEYYPTYVIHPTNSDMGGYGDWGVWYPDYTNYPFMISYNSNYHDGNWGIFLQTAGEHSITIAYTLN